jgi:hypothetical protein
MAILVKMIGSNRDDERFPQKLGVEVVCDPLLGLLRSEGANRHYKSRSSGQGLSLAVQVLDVAEANFT